MFHVEHLEMKFNFKKEAGFPASELAGYWQSPLARLRFFYCEILKLTLLVSGPVGVVTTTGPVR